MITNETIKHSLLDIELLYKKMKFEEEHFRFDTEHNLFIPIYANVDLNPMIKNAEFYLSKGQSGTETILPNDYYDEFLKNTNIKNGFVLTVLEFTTLNNQMKGMIKESEKLIGAIDVETKTNK